MTHSSDLSALNADERMALVGLIKAAIMSDSRVSPDEEDEVALISAALGEESYRQLVDSFGTRFPDEETFKEFLLTITRQDARDTIYGTILEAAAADAMAGHESELLSWLEEVWNIEVAVAEPVGQERDG